jgi:hypothetical protein
MSTRQSSHDFMGFLLRFMLWRFDLKGITTPNGKNRTPSSKFRGAIPNEFSGCATNEAQEKSVSD